MLGLRWQDVDLLTGRATVKQTMYRMPGAKKRGLRAVLFKAPKSQKSIRVIPLPPKSCERSCNWCDTSRTSTADSSRTTTMTQGLVFCQPNGKPLHPGNLVRRDFRDILNTQSSRECGFTTSGIPLRLTGYSRGQYSSAERTTGAQHASIHAVDLCSFSATGPARGCRRGSRTLTGHLLRGVKVTPFIRHPLQAEPLRLTPLQMRYASPF